MNFLVDFIRRLTGRREADLLALLRLREKTIVEREDVVRAREAEIARLADMLRERETVVVEREKEISSNNLAFQKRQDMAGEEIVARDRDIRARDIEIERLSGQLGRCAPIAPPATARLPAAAPAALAPQPATAFDAEAALRRWAQQTERFKAMQLAGAQALIEPYILERHIYGHQIRLIIATSEGRSWYDNLQETEAHQAMNLGMIAPGDTVFDCGCNQGVNALVYANLVGPSGKIVAFDPYPMNAEITRFNAELNGKANIEVVEVGLSSAAAELPVSMGEQCVVLDNKNAADLTIIKLAPLDDFAHLKPAYVKIDIEGAEVDALAGATLLLKQTPALYIEVHPGFLPRFNRKPMDIFDYVSLDDYLCFVNYPGLAPLTPYHKQFELVDHCALFCTPRWKPPVRRYYG